MQHAVSHGPSFVVGSRVGLVGTVRGCRVLLPQQSVTHHRCEESFAQTFRTSVQKAGELHRRQEAFGTEREDSPYHLTSVHFASPNDRACDLAEMRSVFVGQMSGVPAQMSGVPAQMSGVPAQMSGVPGLTWGVGHLV